ncbi:MAG: hypothetical protein IJT21_02140 [Synergistaceae bacterium]|nr:hypothetical protein [Synergistaceae bacterium]
MNIAAFIFAVAGALLSIFQEINLTGGLLPIPGLSIFKIVNLMLNAQNAQFFRGMPKELIFMLIAVVVAAVLAVIAAFTAIKRAGGTGLLVVSALICLGIFGFVNIAAKNELPFMSGLLLQEFAIWGALYLVAAVLCFMDGQNTNDTSSQQN